MADLTDEQCDAFRRLPGSFNDMVRAIYRAGMNAATPPADAALADALESVALGDAMATKELMRQAAAALRARAVPGVPLSALVCVGRARFPRTGGNAGIAWHVEDALSDTGGFRSGSPCNGELLFVLPTTAKRAMLAASQPQATAVPEGMAKLEDKDAQWWLADVDQHGTGWIIDGPHKDRVGADRAFHLHVALGLRPKCRFGVARVTLFEPRENSEGVNREAIALLAASKSGDGGAG